MAFDVRGCVMLLLRKLRAAAASAFNQLFSGFLQSRAAPDEKAC